MSTDWTFHCKDCDAQPDEFEIYSQDVLRSIWMLREHIIALAEQDVSGYIQVSIMSHEWNQGDLWHFLSKHKDHAMELISEYGEPDTMEEHP